MCIRDRYITIHTRRRKHANRNRPYETRFPARKLTEGFQKLSPGGAISYVEVPNMQDNLEAVMSVLQFIYDNIMYAELNLSLIHL